MAEQYEITRIEILKGLEENRSSITPAEGEFLYTIDQKKLYIGDGSTVGGNLVGANIELDLDDPTIQDLILNHTHDHDNLENIDSLQHINHQNIEIIASDGLSGGGTIDSSVTISMGVPGTLTGSTINSLFEESHTHNIHATDSTTVPDTDNDQLLLAKALRHHLETENHTGGSDGTDHTHDHNGLDNVDSNQHIDHTLIEIIGSNGLSGGGNIMNSQTITLNTPGSISGTSINDRTGNHTHEILATDSRNVTNNYEVLLAKGLYDHIQNENHEGQIYTAGSGLTLDSDVFSVIFTESGGNNGELNVCSRGDHTHTGLEPGVHTLDSHEGILSYSKGGTGFTSYTSGQLLIGDGTSGQLVKSTLSSSPGIAIINNDGEIIIEPIFGTTQDTLAQGNHTHDHDGLDNVDSNQHIDHTDINITGDNGLEGGGMITSSRTISLITPGTISGTSTNDRSGSHTHEILATDSTTVPDTDNEQLLLAKALRNHLETENHSGGSDGTDHTHDHDGLDNVDSNQHIDHTDINITGDNGLEGGGMITSSRTISLITPGTISGTSTNDRSGSHTHEILATDSTTVPDTDNEQLLLAKALRNHLETENHSGGSDGTDHTHDHDDITGVVSVSKGGTGQTSYIDGQLLIGNSSGELSKSTLTGTGGVTITNGDGIITIDASAAQGTDYQAGTGLDLTSDTFSVLYGTSNTTACVGDDPRLSDSRTPLSHDHDAADITSGVFHIDRIPVDDITGDFVETTDSRLHEHTIDNDLSNGFGKRYISSSPPDAAFGNDGDIWLQYEE